MLTYIIEVIKVMEKYDLYIGSHVSLNAPEFFLGSVKEAISYGSTTFMFYTGAPQNTYRKPLNELMIEEGRKLLRESGMKEDKLIVHAPYIVNAANKVKEGQFQLSIDAIISELRRTAAFGAKTLVLHPGAHVGQGAEEGIKNIAEALDIILSQDGTDVKIALETMAGKGSEVGVNFEEIKQIIDLCAYKDRLGVCLDTCHLNDAGYDVSDVDGLLNMFDKVVGLDRVLVIHINDSKNPLGAHKDRHENIGYGYIGFETLMNIIHHPVLKDIPKILETPYFEGKPPYKIEIEMLREKKFIENWRDNL